MGSSTNVTLYWPSNPATVLQSTDRQEVKQIDDPVYAMYLKLNTCGMLCTLSIADKLL